MDTSSDAVTTDTLGRRIAPRQRHTVAEKRAMVEESLEPGVSVALIAPRHEVNANQIFAWRRLYRAGLLEAKRSETALQLLPVKLAAARPSAGEREARKRRDGAVRERAAQGMIKIEFPDGQRVQVRGLVDATTLAQVIAALLKP